MIILDKTENKETFWLCIFYLCIALVDLNKADLTAAASSKLGTECQTSDDCSLSEHVICDKETNKCVCKEGRKVFEKIAHCMPVKELGDICETSEQCSKYDPHSDCVTRGSLDPYPRICQCQFGYKEKTVEGKRECVDAHYTLFHTGGLYFDRRDTVPIVMGSLAAGFALLACCAGIVQFVRKKHHNQTYQQSTDSVPHPEAIMLNASNLVPTSPVAVPFHPYFPHTLLDDPPPADTVQMEDLPPSYEEAVKQPPILLPAPTLPDLTNVTTPPDITTNVKESTT